MKNSPLNQLTAQDIARKQKKLDRINTRIEKKDDRFKAKVSSGEKGTDMDITRHERSLGGLKERKHKTEYQINTGERGKPTTLRNEKWLAGTSRKSALNMLGIQPKSPLNNGDLDFDVDYSGAKPVDLGSIKPTERGKKIAAIKKDVSETDDEGLVLKSQHNYFVANPTEESDKMAVKIQDAKTKTLSGGGGKHYKEVEKPLQEELKRKMRNK
ncbi:MAG: hypothetical protein HOF44_10265 [Pelagibacterales bacterium]|jgi:hypothetical protein|nr:hypothetical protein [Pelagibacterales bacterium]